MLIFLPQKAIFFFLASGISESRVRASIFPFHLFLSSWLIESLNGRLFRIKPELLRGKREVILLHCLLSLWLPYLKEIWIQVIEFSLQNISCLIIFPEGVINSSRCLVLLLAYKNIPAQHCILQKKETVILKLYLTLLNLLCKHFTFH